MQKPTSFIYYTGYCEVTIGATWFTVVLFIPMPTPVAPPARQQFDYSLLDSATSDFVQQQTGEIRVLMKRTAEDIREIGLKLIAVKERLGHGYFLDWLEAEFGWHRDMANKFMNVAKQFGKVEMSKLSTFDLTALYQLAAPSTPQAAREEALSRAEAGESISYTTAQSIRQKHTKLKNKQQPQKEPESEPEPEAISPAKPAPAPAPGLKKEALSASLPPQSTPPRLSTPTQSGSKKLEIVAIRPPTQAVSVATANQVITPQITHSATVPPTAPSVSAPDVPGVWWQLGRHLLYCGDPNSSEFLGRIRKQVSLLLAFPIIPGWLPAIPAKTRIVVDEPLSQGRNLAQLDEFLELSVLFNSQLGDLVISCFLPEAEIISIINRFDRKGMFAEPDFKRVNAIITDWKKAGLKTERLS